MDKHLGLSTSLYSSLFCHHEEIFRWLNTSPPVILPSTMPIEAISRDAKANLPASSNVLDVRPVLCQLSRISSFSWLVYRNYESDHGDSVHVISRLLASCRISQGSGGFRGHGFMTDLNLFLGPGQTRKPKPNQKRFVHPRKTLLPNLGKTTWLVSPSLAPSGLSSLSHLHHFTTSLP